MSKILYDSIWAYAPILIDHDVELNFDLKFWSGRLLRTASKKIDGQILKFSGQHCYCIITQNHLLDFGLKFFLEA